MFRLQKKVIAVVCVVAVVLTGCSLPDFSSIIDTFYRNIYMSEAVAYEDMEYVRPDMDQLKIFLEDCCKCIKDAKSTDEIMEVVYDYYEQYDWFYTYLNLADIKYCGDLSDEYWKEEYEFCSQNKPWVDSSLDELYGCIAVSPLCDQLEGEGFFGSDFFDDYSGTDDLAWDEKLLALFEEETQLQNKYYELVEQSYEVEYYSEEYFNTYTEPMTELFVELIEVRQELAAYVGYESYPEFAYDYYYYREYTPRQVKEYTEEIAQRFYELYIETANWDMEELVYDYCSEEETFSFMRDAATAMSGVIEEAFNLLETAGTYDIEYRPKKMDYSFEVYLWSYYEPFIFINPYLDHTDKMLLAHEFGHFAHDYVCNGTFASADICEVNSHAMEYLTLCYGEDTRNLEIYKMANSLSLYMEQSAYAMFELEVYDLKEDELTVDNVLELYETTGLKFGFDKLSFEWDPRDFITVTHFFTEPMYVISYVVSNDLAMQIYQLERENVGDGLEIYEQCLTSFDSDVTFFAEQLGLQSPFEEGRLQRVENTFNDILSKY